jgi:hypothetical protein
MKLFKIEVRFKNRRNGRVGADVIVHAKSQAAAEQHLLSRYAGCQIVHTVKLENVPKHFVLADLTD